MLFKQGVNSSHNVHQNKVENCQHFKWVPNHLDVQVWIIIKHVVFIDIKWLPLQFQWLFWSQSHILPFLEQPIFRLRRRGTVPEMLQKPINRPKQMSAEHHRHRHRRWVWISNPLQFRPSCREMTSNPLRASIWWSNEMWEGSEKGGKFLAEIFWGNWEREMVWSPLTWPYGSCGLHRGQKFYNPVTELCISETEFERGICRVTVNRNLI